MLNPRLIIEDDSKNSKVYHLENGGNLLGRAKTCSIALEQDQKLSREHCLVNIDENEAILIDLNSGNGTFLNKNRIQKINLKYGDTISLGSSEAIFLFDETDDLPDAHQSKTIISTSSLLSRSNLSFSTGTIQTQNSLFEDLLPTLILKLSELSDIPSLWEATKNLLLSKTIVDQICFKFSDLVFETKDNQQKPETYLRRKVETDIESTQFSVYFRNHKGYLIITFKKSIHARDLDNLMLFTFCLEEYFLTRDTSTVLLLNSTNKSIAPMSFIGESEKIKAVKELVKKVGPTDINILLIGASGTGKEVVARELATLDEKRKSGPFVAVNCGAIPENLFESEFFGFTKGSFTGANADKKGYLEQSHGGILFLDEIGELPLEFQAKLLRVLENRENRAIGSNASKPIDFRLIAATNKPLKKLVKENLFREDLYYRLQGVQIDLPMLKERMDDLPILIEHFCNISNPPIAFTGNSEMLKVLMNYTWPGNLRELKNFIQKAHILFDINKISEEETKKLFKKSKTETKIEQELLTTEDFSTLEEISQKYILQVLEHFKGNKSLTAKTLGITRATLYEKLKNL